MGAYPEEYGMGTGSVYTLTNKQPGNKGTNTQTSEETPLITLRTHLILV